MEMFMEIVAHGTNVALQTKLTHFFMSGNDLYFCAKGKELL